MGMVVKAQTGDEDGMIMCDSMLRRHENRL